MDVSAEGVRVCPEADVEMPLNWTDTWVNVVTGTELKYTLTDETHMYLEEESIILEGSTIQLQDDIFKSDN